MRWVKADQFDQSDRTKMSWRTLCPTVPKMKTLWFKVENGPADEVGVNNAQNIKQLKNEMIQQHPRMFGDDQEAGVWNLYKTAQAQEPEDSGDTLDVLGEAGATSRTALILKRVSPIATSTTSGLIGIKSRNGAGQGIVHGLTTLGNDAIPTSSNSSSIYIRTDGIDINTEHLERSELVQKLINLVHSNAIVLLTSPAGSGKSALFKLYRAAATNKNVIGISGYKSGKTFFEVLKAKGIDYENEIIKEELLSGKDVVVFLDDAQAQYSDTRFWEEFTKAAGLWLPKKSSLLYLLHIH